MLINIIILSTIVILVSCFIAVIVKLKREKKIQTDKVTNVSVKDDDLFPDSDDIEKVDQRNVSTDIICKSDKEKNRFVSLDEIRLRAYNIASNDQFKKDALTYWVQAENELKGIK